MRFKHRTASSWLKAQQQGVLKVDNHIILFNRRAPKYFIIILHHFDKILSLAPYIFYLSCIYQIYQQSYSIISAYQGMGCSDSYMGQIRSPQRLEFPRETSSTLEKFIDSSEKKSVERVHSKQALLSLEDINDQYNKVDGDIDLFFNNISEKISELYVKTCSQALQGMNSHRMSSTETKVYISEKILVMSLNVLEVIGKKTNYSYPIDVFKKFNKTQKKLIAYLKMKYPRGGPTFIPGDLTKVFQSFNLVQNPDNDILRNAGICFHEEDEKKISLKLKEMFNKIIDEVDTKYPKFQAFLQEKIFNIEIENKKRSLNYKIGRKLPENIAKYNLNEQEDLEVTSPEIFRVIIKWVGDMEEFILTPDEEVKEKQTFKTYIKEEDGKIEFDEISPEDVENLTQKLKNKLHDVKYQYQEEISKLRKEMDLFNINLLKVLDTAERVEKFVPKIEANVIKYSSFNTKVVSWLIIRKLIFVLKNLIKIGKEVKDETNEIFNLDLIKFNVTDMMRAMVTGNKKQILAVYENMKKFEKEKLIKIIKIKNRFGTPLNDAMIIFMVKDSFLICQLQLILMEGQGTSEKLKNIEFLNHFLYELERSPYGTLSQIAVVLGYKDTKINFENKIKFKTTLKIDPSYCELNHKDSITFLQEHEKPFFCSKCTVYYKSLECVLGMKYCEKCNYNICCRCIYEDKKSEQMDKIHKRFVNSLNSLLFHDKNRNMIPKGITIDSFMKLLQTEKHFLAQKTSKKYQKIHTHDLIKIAESFYSSYFILVNFKGKSTSLKQFFWNSSQQAFEDTLKSEDGPSEKKYFCTSFYDFIIFFNNEKLTITEKKLSSIEKNVKISLKGKQIDSKKVQAVHVHKFAEKDQEVFLVLKEKLYKQSKHQNQSIEEAILENKKQFMHDSIQQARKSIPQLTILKQNFRMQNSGINTSLLKYFSTCEWKNQIKVLDLTDNIITDISLVLDNLNRVECIYISKNFIREIKIKKKLEHLKKFICCDNRVEKIEGFNLLSSLKKLNFSKNRLKIWQKVEMKQLKQLVLSQNLLESLIELQNSKAENLQNLVLVSNSFYTPFQKVTLPFPKLKKVKLSYTMISNLTILSSSLQYLESNNCEINLLQLNPKNLKQLCLDHNKFDDFKIFEKEFPKLQKISIQYNQSQIQNIPTIISQRLTQISFYGLVIKNLENLQHWKTPLLQKIEFGSGYETIVLPSMNFPNLLNIDFSSLIIKDIRNIENSNLPKIKTLSINGQSKENNEHFPFLSLPELENLSFSYIIFQNCESLKKVELSKLKVLNLTTITLKELPPLNLPSIEEINISSCQIQKFELINNLPKSLKILKLDSLKIGNLPLLNNEKLEELYYTSCELFDVSMLEKSNIKNLKSLTINSCGLEKLPKIDIQNLTSLNFYDNKLSNIDHFLSSHLPKLEYLNLQYNKLQNFPIFKFKSLQSLSVTSNPFKNLQNLQFCSFQNLLSLEIYQGNLQSTMILPCLNLPKVTSLSISNSGLTDIGNLQKSNLPLIENLTLDYNPIKKLPILKAPFLKVFSLFKNQSSEEENKESTDLEDIENLTKWDCPCLESINIDNNKITKLPKLNFPLLNTFSFVGNPISNYKQFTQSNLPQYTYFYSYSEQLQNIIYVKNSKYSNYQVYYAKKIKNISDAINIKADYLTFTSCQLQEIPPEMLYKEISYLNLSQNKITKIISAQAIKPDPIQFIKTLNLYNNLIEEWPDIKIINLETINLSFNRLKKFAPSNITFDALISLELQNNQISQIKLPFSESSKIQYIYLNSNSIVNFNAFEKNIKMKNLYNLQLNSCQLQTIEYVPSCSTLSLSTNKLKNISFLNEKQIEYLYLQNNEIESLEGFSKLKSLYHLKLSNNKIQTTISNLDFPKLTTLQLQRNKIKKVNITNKMLPELSQLYLTQNQITEFSVECSKLVYLSLDRNKIKNLQPFLTIKDLSTISLNNNQLQNLEWLEKSQVKKLCELNVSENKISTLPDFSKCKSLYSASFDSNPLTNFEKVLNLKKKINLTLNYSFDEKMTNQEREKLMEKIAEKIEYPNCYNPPPPPDNVQVEGEENVIKDQQ